MCSFEGMKPITFREINLEDKQEVIDFCIYSIGQQFPEYALSNFKELPDWADDLTNIGYPTDYYSKKNRGCFITMKNSKQIAGTIGIMNLKKDWWCLENIDKQVLACQYEDTANVCVLTRFYIKDKYRGKGFGKILMKLIMEKANELGYSMVHLYTHRKTSQFNSVEYFSKNGFSIIYENQDTVHMNKKL